MLELWAPPALEYKLFTWHSIIIIFHFVYCCCSCRWWFSFCFFLDVIFPLTFDLINMPLLFPDMSVDPWFHTIPALCSHWLKPQDHRAKLAQTVPFKVAINISRPDRLVQTASYMPESQLHLHSRNNEPMNPALLEKAERLESIRMDCRGKGRSDLDSLHSQKSFPKFEFIWMPMGFLQNPSHSPAQVVLLICRER